MPRAEKPVAVLSDHNDGQMVARLRSQDLAESWIADEESGNCVGVEDQRHSSG